MKQQNPSGSFGIPQDMKDAINDIEQKKRENQQKEPTSDVEEIVTQPVLEKKKETEESEPLSDNFEELTVDQKEKKVKEVLEEIRKNLDIEITEDDIWSFLYNNEIIKRNVVIMPGKMVATFKTISLDATNLVDSKMAEILDEKRLEAGFKNLNTQHVLSQGLIELGKPGKLKSLGETPEERFKVVGKMSALLVEKLGRKWNTFVFLVDEAVKEEMESKKD